MKTVLFVCMENAFRSQIAEAFFNKFATKGLRAVSAGATPASSVNPGAVKIMEETGIDISGQKPRLLTPELVESADAVITMGCGAEACPFIGKAVDWGIESPKDKPMHELREIRDEIKKRVEKLIESIKEE